MNMTASKINDFKARRVNLFPEKNFVLKTRLFERQIYALRIYMKSSFSFQWLLLAWSGTRRVVCK